MKSKTIWTIIGVVILIAIIYFVYKYINKDKISMCRYADGSVAACAPNSDNNSQLAKTSTSNTFDCNDGTYLFNLNFLMIKINNAKTQSQNAYNAFKLSQTPANCALLKQAVLAEKQAIADWYNEKIKCYTSGAFPTIGVNAYPISSGDVLNGEGASEESSAAYNSCIMSL